jgi:DNA polymerase
MGESSADVSADVQARAEAAAELAAEALRHLAWLRSAGIRELPPPPAVERLGPPPAFPPVPGATATPAGDGTPARQARVVGPQDAATQGVPPRTGADAGPERFAGAKGCGSPALRTVREDLGDCARCKLAKGRHHVVFGVGNPGAELVFVGEGPGEDEDLKGEPFVGRAGQLLTKMIEAMGYARSDVYIANVVKCRPPGNRNPEPDEIEACEPFLRAQLAAIRPRVIVALGKFAAQTLLRDGTPISRLRGRWFTYEGVKLMPTFHPAYLLRSPEEKKKAWEDLQLVMNELGRPLARR